MRIGFDAKRAFNNRSGLGNYSRFVIDAIASNFPEHDFFLYTTKVTIDELKSKNLAVRTPGRVYNSMKSLWRTTAIKKQLVRDKIDVYHGLSHELPININRLRIKSVVTIHDLIFLRYPELFKKADRAIYFQKWKYACQVADRIIAVSEQTKSDLCSYMSIPGKKIDVVYQDCHEQFSNDVAPDVDAMKEKYGLPNEYLLCVGTVEKRKNQEMLVRALPQLKHRDVDLVIVGKNTSYKSFLDTIISKNGLQHRVHFRNNIQFVDFPALYAGARLFLYLSVFEGFGIPIIEAMRMDIPVITTKGGVFEETGGKAARYVDSSNSGEVAEAIDELLEDESKRNGLVEAGKENVRRFESKKVGAQLMRVYEGLVI